MRHNHCKIGRQRSITKCTLLHRPKQFFVPVALQLGDVDIKYGTPSPCGKPLNVWSKSGCNEEHFRLETAKAFRSYLARNSVCVMHSLPMRHEQRKFVRNLALTKGTLQLRTKHFLVILSSDSSGVTESSHMALSVHAPQPLKV
jgi:hypothetical protein